MQSTLNSAGDMNKRLANEVPAIVLELAEFFVADMQDQQSMMNAHEQPEENAVNAQEQPKKRKAAEESGNGASRRVQCKKDDHPCRPQTARLYLVGLLPEAQNYGTPFFCNDFTYGQNFLLLVRFWPVPGFLSHGKKVYKDKSVAMKKDYISADRLQKMMTVCTTKIGCKKMCLQEAAFFICLALCGGKDIHKNFFLVLLQEAWKLVAAVCREGNKEDERHKLIQDIATSIASLKDIPTLKNLRNVVPARDIPDNHFEVATKTHFAEAPEWLTLQFAKGPNNTCTPLEQRYISFMNEPNEEFFSRDVKELLKTFAADKRKALTVYEALKAMSDDKDQDEDDDRGDDEDEDHAKYKGDDQEEDEDDDEDEYHANYNVYSNHSSIEY